MNCCLISPCIVKFVFVKYKLYTINCWLISPYMEEFVFVKYKSCVQLIFVMQCSAWWNQFRNYASPAQNCNFEIQVSSWNGKIVLENYNSALKQSMVKLVHKLYLTCTELYFWNTSFIVDWKNCIWKLQSLHKIIVINSDQ